MKNLILLAFVGFLMAGCLGPDPTVSPLMTAPGLLPPDTIPVWLVEVFQAFAAMPEVKFLVGHILLNTIVAVAAALLTSQFDVKKFSEFLTRKITPFLLVYIGARLFGEAAGVPSLATVVLGVLESRLLVDLAENLKVLGVELGARK